MAQISNYSVGKTKGSKRTRNNRYIAQAHFPGGRTIVLGVGRTIPPVLRKAVQAVRVSDAAAVNAGAQPAPASNNAVMVRRSGESRNLIRQ